LIPNHLKEINLLSILKDEKEVLITETRFIYHYSENSTKEAKQS
jgi:hypothetical protein